MSEGHSFLKVLQAAGLYKPNGHAPKVDFSGMPLAASGDPDAARYAAKALQYECEAVQDAQEGARNDTLNRASYKLGSLVSAGHIDGQVVIDNLAAAARVAGLPASEINRTVYRAVSDGGRTPRQVKLEPRPEIPAAYTFEEIATAEDPFDPPGQLGDSGDSPGGKAPEEQLADIAAMYPALDWPAVFAETPEDVEWIAYPLFEKGKLYSLYSPAKAGKSLFALDVCASLATPRGVLGAPSTAPLRVLYVDLENSPVDLVERLQDLGYEAEELDNLRYLSFPNLPALDSPIGGQHLLYAAMHYRADVVVIDTVSRMIAGKENDSDTFHQLYRYACAPLKRIGVTVIRLDHSGKDEDKGMRGSSAKVSDVDAAWKLSRTGEGRLRLERTASRNSHSPEYVAIEQESGPLRHVVISEQVDDAVTQLVNTLDRLGIPSDWGRDNVKKRLTENGYKVRNATLSEAIRARKTSFGGEL